MISLEASNQPGSFVGILHNGQMKNPRHTKRGRDGSFTVVFVELSNGLTGAEVTCIQLKPCCPQTAPLL